ncbi:MAG: hypothetical protein AAF804_04685, partial [Bacteroidota bacterium]
MRKLLLIIALALWAGITPAQVVIEDFENGAALSWNASDGTYDGVLANPDANFVNDSDSVGAYTKSGSSAFSLFLADLAAPLDLSTNNQFSIQIYAPVATAFILKLEGPGGQAIEATKNIANANVWQEYHFDFSAAAGLNALNRIILFFDPGVASSDDTYLFDNLVASPAGPCAGTMPDPLIIDDFECQRNASYGAGWDIITAIANPDPTGINTSASVGQYLDPPGTFSALVVNYRNPIDLSVNNTIKAKVWAPKTGQLLFKLEGGASPAKEIFIDVLQTNQWVEYSADFSSEANANHLSLAIFFNAGVEPDSGDTYFIDDIVYAETPQQLDLEDFEPTPKLSWEPLDNNMALHGTFNGVVANPDQAGVNGSPNVGQYTKGTAAFSTITSLLPLGFSLAQFSQVNLMVRPPANSTEVTLQLLSATEGTKEATIALDASTDWQELSFDFSAFVNVTDFERVSILFDPGSASQGQVWLFDNLNIGNTTIDPCVGVDPIPNVLDDFECQRNVTYGAGEDRLSVILNPDVSPGNSSERVGEYSDPLDEFSALVLEFGGTIDLSVFNQFRIKIWAENTVPLLFKLEGGSDPAVEVTSQVTATQSWEAYEIDLSPYAGQDHQRLAIFFNVGVTPSQNDLYYIDDLEWGRLPFTDCVADFESSTTSLTEWQYFANGEGDGTVFEVIDNPDQSGINTSAKVGTFLESSSAGAASFAGMFTVTMPAAISLPNDNKTVKMKVWSTEEDTIVFKLEQGQDGAPGSGDIFGDVTTTPNTWTEITFDFTTVVPDNSLYDRITLIPGFGVIPTADKTYYFDDIVIGNASCATTSIFEPKAVVALQAYPNPSTGW